MAKEKVKASEASSVEEVIINPFGTTFEIEVDNYLGVKKCIIPFPDRKSFFQIIRIIDSDTEAELTVGEKLLSKMVSGDTEFLSDDIYILIGAMKAVQEFELRSSFIKKNSQN